MMPARPIRALSLAAALLTAGLALSACSAPAPAVTASSPAASKDASLFTKDVFVCIENTSSSPVTIDWRSGVSSTSGSGQLAVGQKFCGEGGAPQARITFGSGFANDMRAINPAFSEPSISFLHKESYEKVVCADSGSCGLQWTQDAYVTQWYSIGESRDNNVEGHNFIATRNANNDWVNFTVKIAS
jgi:hypothetical protein